MLKTLKKRHLNNKNKGMIWPLSHKKKSWKLFVVRHIVRVSSEVMVGDLVGVRGGGQGSVRTLCTFHSIFFEPKSSLKNKFY